MEKIDLIGLGAGGHANVLIDIINKDEKYNFLGLIDSELSISKNKNFKDINILGSDKDLEKFFKQGIVNIFLGIGFLDDTKKNKLLFDNVKKIGFNVISVIHHTAIVSSSVNLMMGVKIMAGSIVNPHTEIGNNCIINTGSIIEHDCYLEDHVQIGPGSRIAGNVRIGEGSIIGLGAKVIQGINIGSYSMIGAGAVVTKNVGSNIMVAGVPATEKKKW